MLYVDVNAVAVKMKCFSWNTYVILLELNLLYSEMAAA